MRVIIGTGSNDVLTGTAENNVIYAELGNDSVNAGDGDDFILGGAGADTLLGGSGQDYINGGEGNDILEGNEGNDILYGGDGEDILSGGEGNDALFGEGGNDLLNLGPGADLAWGGAGGDIFVINSALGVESAELASTIADFSSGEDAIQVTGEIAGISLNLTATSLEDLQNNSNQGSGQPLITVVQGSGNFASDVLIQNTATGQILAVVKNQQAPTAIPETPANQVATTIPNLATPTTPSPAATNNAPEDIVLANASIAENSANGLAIGTLSTTDPDAGDSHSYQLLDNASGRFAISGNMLVVANGLLLDFETATSHNITVRSTDAGGLSFDKVLTITVTDVNEAIANSNPTDIVLTNSAIAENSSNGTVIGNLSSADPDIGDTHSYSLIDNASGRFAINGNTLPMHTIRDTHMIQDTHKRTRTSRDCVQRRRPRRSIRDM